MSLIILPCRPPSSGNWHDPLKMGWSVGRLVSWLILAMVGQLGVGQLVGWSVLLVPIKLDYDFD